jgi:hypothetical protein
MSDSQTPQPPELVVVPDGGGGADGQEEASAAIESVAEPAKVMRIGAMVKELLEEVRRAPLDEKGRARLREIHETSIRELAETIVELAGTSAELELGPAREWDRSGHRFGSPEKARRELGFEAKVPLGEGLRETVEWTKANLGWIDSCIRRHADRIELPAELTLV